jgi:ABC-2 type transport system permease protein
MWFGLSMYWRLIALQTRAQLQYRTAFMLEVLATAITLSTFFAALVLVFQRFRHIGGWTLSEVAFLWGLVELSFGLMDMIFSGFDPATFGQRVRLGTFDQLLLRPLNISLQVLGSDFVLRRLGRIIQGGVILGIALTLVNIQWSWAKLLYLPVVIAGMICFFGALFIIGATITFWTVESVEVINIFTYGGSELIAYPMHIYPDWLRRLFTYIIPAGLLNYYPALFFLDKPDPFGLPIFVSFLAPIAGLGMLLIALAFWQFGIKYYQSTGS